jgi:hypothetical protein
MGLKSETHCIRFFEDQHH